MGEMADELIEQMITIQTGGWCNGEEPWYDSYEITIKEGNTCPFCYEGKLLVSRQGKLYCSKICWVKKVTHMLPIEGDF